MGKEKLKLKISWETFRVFATLTIVFTLMGFLFGRVLETVFLDNSTTTNQPVEEVAAYLEDGNEAENSEETPNETPAAEVTPENTFFVLQVGAFETFDNAAAMGGRLDDLDITWGINRIDGRHYVFSHIVSDREQLTDAVEKLEQNGISPFARSVEADTNDLRWYYFLKAVQQIPYEMDSEFIQIFTSDELHIFGLYSTLASVSFEPLSSERQEILLDIYNWLNN